MAVEARDGKVWVSGEVPVEDVEALVGVLEQVRGELGPKSNIPVELGECLHMHTAGLQAMLERRCEVQSWPAASEWTEWLRAGLEL